MKFIHFASLAGISTCFLLCSASLMAEENTTHQFTPKDEIKFSASTKNAFDFSGKNVTRVVLPDGTIMMKHNGTMQSVTVARLAADGSIETYCTTSEAEAREFMAGGIVESKSAVLAPSVRTQ